MEREQRKAINEFIQSEKILIVEPSPSFQKVLATCMMDLGASPENIIQSKRYGEAFNALFRHKPRIVLSEFFIEEQHGLSLIDIQSQFYDDSKKIAVLTTHNASDSAVAEAAEGHVDDYVLKPYPVGTLKARLESIILKKINPSNYIQKINDGKRFLAQKEFDKAAREFNDAATIHDSPALAFYYGGYTQHLQSQYDAALAAYRKSRSIQKMHYKSIMGEFDALYEQKRYAQAYEMVPVIRENFPISPRRLGNIIITAVYSQNFQDIRALMQIYLKFENPAPELTKIISVAFMTVGRHYIKLQNAREARISFEFGLRVIGPDIVYIDKSVRELLKVRSASDALLILQKFPSEHVGGKTYCQLKFLVDQFFDKTHDHIEKGRRLVSMGFADQDCYRLLLQILIDMNKRILAEDIANKAIEAYPEMRNEINALL